MMIIIMMMMIVMIMIMIMTDRLNATSNKILTGSKKTDQCIKHCYQFLLLTCTQIATVTKGHSTDRPSLIRRSAKLRIRAAQECPEVASELVQDIFEFFD